MKATLKDFGIKFKQLSLLCDNESVMKDFGIKFKQVPLLCDSESAVKLTNNQVQHQRTKHINV
jgi:cystathionine beta-lyase family protein involved in aluminum resistance